MVFELFSNSNGLDKKSPIPLYYQLKNLILDDIKSGKYALGESIPTEAEIIQEYQISRSTARQAIKELVQEGWLERKTSKGTFVTNPKEKTSHIRSFEPFYQQVSRLGKKAETELLELKIIEAPADIAQIMGLTENKRVITMFRRRFADGEPMVTLRNYLPVSLCKFILTHDFTKESLYEVLMANEATRMKKTKTIVSANKAASEDVYLLNVKLSSPILCFNNTSINANDQVVELAYLHYRGDLNKFEIDAFPE